MDFKAFAKKYAYFLTAGGVVLAFILIGWLVVGGMRDSNAEDIRELERIDSELARQNRRDERPDPEWIKEAEGIAKQIDASTDKIIAEIERRSMEWLNEIERLQSARLDGGTASFIDEYNKTRNNIPGTKDQQSELSFPIGPPRPEDVEGTYKEERGSRPTYGRGDFDDPGRTRRGPDRRTDRDGQPIVFWEFSRQATPEDRLVASVEAAIIERVTEVLGRYAGSGASNKLPDVLRMNLLRTRPGGGASPAGASRQGAGTQDRQRTDGGGKAFLADARLVPSLKEINPQEFARESNLQRRREAIIAKLKEVQPVVFHKIGVDLVLEVRQASVEVVLDALMNETGLMFTVDDIRVQATVDPFNPGLSEVYTAYPLATVTRVYVKGSAYRLLDCRDRAEAANRIQQQSLEALALIISAKAEKAQAQAGTGDGRGRGF